MNTVTAELATRRTSIEVGVWIAGTIIAGLLLPGLGIAVGLIAAFTRLRWHNRLRVALPLLGIAVLALQIVGLQQGQSDGSSGPATAAAAK